LYYKNIKIRVNQKAINIKFSFARKSFVKGEIIIIILIMPKLKIKNLGIEFEYSPVITLFNNLAMNGVMVYNECGGKGRCGMCKIKILSEQDKRIKKATEIEKKLLSIDELENGIRLSCQTYAIKDIEILVHGARIVKKKQGE
jgi:ferredoxin